MAHHHEYLLLPKHALAEVPERFQCIPRAVHNTIRPEARQDDAGERRGVFHLDLAMNDAYITFFSANV